jgi:tetratricopeptide (TPR) repeat protein
MLPDRQLAKPQQAAWIRWMLPPAVLAVILILTMTKWLQFAPAFLAANRNAVYQVHDGVWKRLPELRSEAEKVEVSPAGKLWALTWHYGKGSELARLDGAAWRTFTPSDFGTKGIEISNGFQLDGEDVWTASDKGVLRWDGQRWKDFPNVTGGSSIVSLTAADGKAWAIDDLGTLASFDGTQWTTQKVELPGATWKGGDEEVSPELAHTTDGSLWIVKDGVWRQNGSAWVAVHAEGDDLKEAGLAGTSGRNIWLWGGMELKRVSADGTVTTFTSAALGLGKQEYLRHVAQTGERVFTGTTKGLLELDGQVWRRLPLPAGGVTGVPGLCIAENGDLFAVGSSRSFWGERGGLLLRMVPLLLSIGLFAAPAWAVRRYKRYRLSEHLQLQDAVAHGTGAVPEEFERDVRTLERQSSWWSAALTIGVLAGAFVGFSIARMFWPHVPAWLFLALALGLHLLVSVQQTLVRRIPKPWDPIEPGGPRFDWGPTRRALPASLAAFVLLNAGGFPRWMGSPVSWLLYGLLAMLWYALAEQKLIQNAIGRGDYEGGMKVVQRFRFFNPQGGAAQFRRGHLLLLAGRYHEAEESLRSAAAQLRSRQQQAQVLELLGDALMEQRRYIEAQRSYEAAVHATAGFRRPYRGMAELLLRQGRDAVRALEAVENIKGPMGITNNRLTINGKAGDDYWSLKAWALAELGGGAEVQQAAAESIRQTNMNSRPDTATTYRRLGLAMRALDRQSEADDYLQKAVDADPHGRWGLLAKAALAEKSVWRV